MPEKKEIKVGDWVRVRKVGIDGLYEVESIDGENIVVTQKEGSWVSRLKLKLDEVIKRMNLIRNLIRYFHNLEIEMQIRIVMI